jgi:hypothetical protein
MVASALPDRLFLEIERTVYFNETKVRGVGS